ncbi:hypothetical protein UFOVP71_175 [uncultured Caudovirales phage]|uniref:Uncharacterized protein n=1 Tax=uncultured Caudovirales phage TaxID=2100421 RepID=A0A6J5TCG6_9CAUD|nr:hypothetical protein UFOVP71_175 [uncultured Caudovirales phage]
MSQQLHTALTSILAMPYFKNENARSGGASYGHEDAVAIRIKDSGFTEQPKTLYPKLKKGLLKKWAESGNDADLRKVTAGMPPGTFVLQPAGSQGFPDILVKDFNDRFVAVECKSGQTGLCPMWNDSLPRPFTIYVLASGIQNATTVFMGRDVISSEEQLLMDEEERAIAKIVKEYNQRMAAIDKFNRGWLQKSRKQHFQGGGGKKTNYFTHLSRSECEKNALEYAQQ